MKFDSYHPMINVVYFVGVILCACFFDHPVALAIGWICAFAYSVKLNGLRALIFNLATLVLAAAFTLFFAGYNHFGITSLGHNFIGNTYTLESLVVGAVIGLKISIVLMWLSCMHAIFSSDKVVYLLGRISPMLSLLLALILRMVPRIKAEWRRVSIAQRGIGKGTMQGNVFMRIRNFFRIASITLTWFMESVVTTSDSMRSRGLGLRHRSAFSIYRFDGRDRAIVIVLFACVSLLVAGWMLDQMTIIYNPEIIMNRMTPLSSTFFIAYFIFCSLPLVLQIVSEWRFERARCA